MPPPLLRAGVRLSGDCLRKCGTCHSRCSVRPRGDPFSLPTAAISGVRWKLCVTVYATLME